MRRVRDYWRQVRCGTLGLRFRNFYAWRHERRAGSPWERVVVIALGLFLIVGGLAIGWLPGPGGFVAVIGAALLGTEWLSVAKALDCTEVRVRRIVSRIRDALPTSS